MVGALTILGMVFAQPLAWSLASGFAAQPGKLELTASLARLMMPFLLLLSLAAVMMGMLNARGRFGMPALAPALFNLAAIGVGIGLKIAGAAPEIAVYGWALGTLLGGMLQLAVQLPQLWADGYRLIPRFLGIWKDPAVRRIARLMAPATVGLAAVQINIFINTQFASGEPGAVAWLNYAFRLMYLPIGIFGVAIATVTASSLAQRAAHQDIPGMRAALSQGLRQVAFLTVPSTFGLAVLAPALIALIYQHGRFTSSDTTHTSLALMGYAVGLYAYSGVKVAAPAFYALDKSRVPVIASLAAVATNLVFNAIAHRWLGYVGLALGTSLGAIVNLLILTIAFRKATRGAPAPSGLFLQLAKVILASAAMGAAIVGAIAAIDSALAGVLAGWKTGAVCIGLSVPAGGLVYFAACRLLRVTELDQALAVLRRRARA